jgi:hypothetical protein
MTDTAPASTPATDAAPTPSTVPQLAGRVPDLPRLPGETPRAYSAFTAFFLLGQAPTSSAQSPTASDENSFSGHKKSRKVTKSHLCSPLAAAAHSSSARAWPPSHGIPPPERQYGHPIQCLYSQRVAVQNHIVKVQKRIRALVKFDPDRTREAQRWR